MRKLMGSIALPAMMAACVLITSPISAAQAQGSKTERPASEAADKDSTNNLETSTEETANESTASATSLYNWGKIREAEPFSFVKVRMLPNQNPLPANDRGRWVTANDYPYIALLKEQEGTVTFRVKVNELGTVNTCDIVESSGHTDLDVATCKHVSRRARFFLGTDSDGKYSDGEYTSQVAWQIPKSAPTGTGP